MKLAYFYIDGLNLNKSLNKRLRWLNLILLAQLLLQRSGLGLKLGTIYYYATKYKVVLNEAANQRDYLAALRQECPSVKVRLGSFEEGESDDEDEVALEEKETDVAIGCQMVVDAFEQKKDMGAAFLISNDADFIPAIRAVRRRGKKAVLVAPNSAVNKQLAKVAGSKNLQILKPNDYQKCQLPNRVVGKKILTRPENWSYPS